MATRKAEIARRIRNLRREQRLTLPALCHRISIVGPAMSESSLKRLESGERSLTLVEAVNIAACLGVTLDYLAGLESGYRKVGTQ